jgi:hypothetical protein
VVAAVSGLLERAGSVSGAVKASSSVARAQMLARQMRFWLPGQEIEDRA